ncbi:MAG: molybdenum cofactor guanylyltransferase [Actinobacteria bacterium]|nr:MAG: molybdenum cofactor guanylyltransferase [Actinomycetota bacterium]
MKQLTGIVLAGGKSSRFESPKYLATLRGNSLIEIAVSKLRPLCQELIVVSKDVIDIAGFDNVIEKDREAHPLIGIKEGLKASSSNNNLVLACDMPFVSKKTIAALTKSQAEVYIYRYKGRFEPLLGLYKRSCIDKIENYKDKKIIDVLQNCDFDYIEAHEECFDFFNINTKEDLIEAQKIAEENSNILGS